MISEFSAESNIHDLSFTATELVTSRPLATDHFMAILGRVNLKPLLSIILFCNYILYFPAICTDYDSTVGCNPRSDVSQCLAIDEVQMFEVSSLDMSHHSVRFFN